MRDMTVTASAPAAEDDFPELWPAWRAAKVACCSPKTLSRMAAAGKIREFRREGYSARFYAREDIERVRPKLVVKKQTRARTP